MKKYDIFYSAKNSKAYLQDCDKNEIVMSIDCKSKKHCNYIAFLLKQGGFIFYDNERREKEQKK